MKEEKSELNFWLQLILALNMIGCVRGIFVYFPYLFAGEQFLGIIAVISCIMAIIGILMIYNMKRVGYYIIVLSFVLNIVASLFIDDGLYISPLLSLLVFHLILFLRKDGISAYKALEIFTTPKI